MPRKCRCGSHAVELTLACVSCGTLYDLREDPVHVSAMDAAIDEEG